MKLNEEINAREVRLIGEEGEQYGIVSLQDALDKARTAEIDLAEIAPTATPPVCKLMDYGKYKYKLQKKEHDARKKSHGMAVKQLRIKTFRIDPHDLGIKIKKARQFIEGGNRLLMTLMFRAREHSHSELGVELLQKFATELDDISKVDSPPRKDGRKMTMTLSPLPNLPKILENRKKEEAKAALKAEQLKKMEQEESSVDDAPVEASENNTEAVEKNEDTAE